MTTNVTQNWMQEIFPKYPKCFYVFVGDKQIRDTEALYDNIEVISKHFGRATPTSIVVKGKYSTPEIEEFSSYFRNTTLVKQIRKI